MLEFGAALAGVVLVTVNPSYQAKELEYVLRQSRASGLFYLPSFRGNPMEQHLAEVRGRLPEPARANLLRQSWDEFLASADPSTALPEVSPADPVQIQYTSGTTGFPKGAYLHHRGITNNARFFAERLGVGAGERLRQPDAALSHRRLRAGRARRDAVAALRSSTCSQFDPGLMLELAET